MTTAASNVEHSEVKGIACNNALIQTEASLVNLQGESAKSENRTSDKADTFSGLIERAINLGSGYRQKSREIAAVHYAAAHQYDIDEPNREAYEAELKALCAKNNVEVTPGKTSPYHMIVRLTFTDATKQYVSDKVHVLSVALAKKIKPEDFLTWLENEKGERKIVETYKRDGSLKQEPTNEDNHDVSTDDLYRERNRNTQAQRARQHSVAFTIHATTTSQVPPQLQIDTECAAIIVRQADGSIIVKAVAADRDIAEEVYASYYRANSDDIDSAVQKQKIVEILEKPECLTVTEIRKELGDDIANKVAKAANNISEYNQEILNIPNGLKKYISLLKKGDLVFGTTGAVSYASYYERAIEELEQEIGDDPTFSRYLDRPFDRTVTLCPENMPRPIGSKSRYAKNSVVATRQSAIRSALEYELENLRGVRKIEAGADDLEVR
ncbi:hypothetical protein [Paraburkholderia heleia]|uniref:hypothetical protein n=1 Tax=Paraburkholderia heleia TaxID=634127 RepID=UPI0031CDC5B0